MYKRANRSYDEGDDGEEEERAGDPGREESFSFAFAQHLPLLQHQVDEGEQHAVDHRLPRNASKHKFDPRRLENEMPLAKVCRDVETYKSVQLPPEAPLVDVSVQFKELGEGPKGEDGVKEILRTQRQTSAKMHHLAKCIFFTHPNIVPGQSRC